MRRKTATPEELLYAEAPPSVSTQRLRPLAETPEDEKVALRLKQDKHIQEMNALVNGSTDSSLMPPPRQLPAKQLSASNLPKYV